MVSKRPDGTVDPSQFAFSVVAIGTLPDRPDDWLIGILPLADYLAGHSILGNVKGLPDTKSEVTGERYVMNMVNLAMHLNGGAEGNRGRDPLLSADVMGYVDLRGKITDGYPDSGDETKWVVSRLFYTPAGDFEATARITGFRLLAHIPMPMNAHQGSRRKADSNDTRFVLEAHAHNNAGTRSLWAEGAGAQEEHEGMWFDFLNLLLSNSAFRGGAAHYKDCRIFNGRLVHMVRAAPGFPSKLAGGEGADGSNINSSGTRDLWPWLSHVPKDITATSPPFHITHRFWGLRIGETKDVDPNPAMTKLKATKLLLRLDLLTRINLPSSYVFTQHFKDSQDILRGSLRFSVEQRIGDVGRTFRPGQSARWIWAMQKRYPASGNDSKKILGIFNAATRRIGQGSRNVRDETPFSALPTVREFANELLVWQVTGLLVDEQPWLRVIDFPPDDGDHVQPPDWSPVRRFDYDLRSLEPAAIRNMWYPTARTRLGLQPSDGVHKGHFAKMASSLGEAKDEIVFDEMRISAPRLLGITSTETEPATDDTAFQPAVSAADALRSIERSIRFAMDVSGVAHKPKPDFGPGSQLLIGRVVEIGALQFQLAPKPKTAPGKDTLVVLHHYGSRLGGGSYIDPLIPTGISARMRVGVEKVSPGRQDPPETSSDYRPIGRDDYALFDRSLEPDPTEPLLYQLDNDGLTDNTEYTLDIRETVARGKDHQMTISLLARDEAKNGAESKTGSVLIIDPLPLRVMSVSFLPLSNALSDQSQEVATWASDAIGGASWQLRDAAQSVELTGSPAVIGEAMEKNAETIGDRPPDIQTGKPAAARFGSLTRLDINPSLTDRAFREPGWNLRRILGYPGQRAPGSRLKQARVELGYGMTAHIAPQVDVQVSEMTSILGAAPVPIADVGGVETVKSHLEYVRSILGAEPNRIAVDKLWTGRADTPLQLESGVSFRLRRRTEESNGGPSVQTGGPATPFRWPVPGDILEPLHVSPQDVKEVLQSFSLDPRDTKSFPGGLPWAFESANILLEVYGTKNAIGGRISDLHLSVLGGWGNQRGLFALGKSIIETETAQGRMHRYKLERIGRIGGLWNRAKHIIIYERSVVPPRQFYNQQPIGKLQDEHAGRPILRKVEEFVEIMEPLRRFPENGKSIAAAGCLTGAEFKSTKIRVDSRWGSDVRREGWKVPLWNTKFATSNASVGGEIDPDDPSLIYPKPQINGVFQGESGAEIRLEIDQPEKLVFYTSTLPDDRDDTDVWRPVRDVDFKDLPPPESGRIKPSSDALTDAMLPAEPAQIAGWEALTIGLTRSQEAVALMHGRSEGPGARIKNITLSRSTASANVAATGMTSLATSSADLRAVLDTELGKALGALEKLDPSLNAADASVAKAAAVVALKSALNSTGLDKVTESLTIAGLGDLTINTSATEIETKIRAQMIGGIERLMLVSEHQIDEISKRLAQPFQAVGGIAETLRSVIAGLEDDYWPNDLEVEDLAEAVRNLANSIFHFEEIVDDDINSVLGSLEKLREGISTGLGTETLGLEEAEIKTIVDALQKAAALKSALNANGALPNGPVTAAASALADAIADFASGLPRRLKNALAGGGGNAQKRALSLAVDVMVGNLKILTDKIAGNLITKAAALEHLDPVVGLLQAVQTALNVLDPSKIMKVPLAELNTLLLKSENLLRLSFLGSASEKGTVSIVAEAVVDDDLLETMAILEAELESGPDEDDPNPIQTWKTSITEILIGLTEILDDISAPSTERIAREKANLIAEIKGQVRLFNNPGSAPGQIIEELVTQVASALKELQALVNSLLSGPALKALLANLTGLQNVAGFIDDLTETVEAALSDIQVDTGRKLEDIKAAIQNEVETFARDAEQRAQALLATMQETVTEALGTDPLQLADDAVRLVQEGSDTLKLIRAVGDPPETDRLGLNRPEVAYILDEANRFVDITPAIALVNRASNTIAATEKAGQAVGELLGQFGVRLPTGKLGDQLMPDGLRNLSVSALLPDMAGLNLEALLSQVGFPDLSDSDAVKITQGFDKAARRAWLKAEIDVPFTESLEILNFGPVQIVIDDARFKSEANVSAGLDGTVQTVKGRIGGDWRVVSIGQDILTFRQTGLFFDESGKLDFRISPERVELADALEFLTNFLAASGQGEGLVIGPLMRGSVPAGVKATLDLALPNLTLGVFSITDLALHVSFGIAALPEFELMSELSVGQRTAPFTVTVWILNGGGYVTQRLSYRPLTKPAPALTYTLDVGIVAGVGLFFNFGVVSGGVSLQVGCSIAVTWTTVSGGNTTTITVFILARGNVDVAGLVTASIMLLLEVSYDGSLMLGRGTLRLSFKISCFYTLNVNQSVEYVFAGEKKEQSPYAENFE